MTLPKPDREAGKLSREDEIALEAFRRWLHAVANRKPRAKMEKWVYSYAGIVGPRPRARQQKRKGRKAR